MENWNTNEWQGKRRDQVEYSSKIGFYSLVGAALIILFGLLTKFF
jgi:hypothetical protein